MKLFKLMEDGFTMLSRRDRIIAITAIGVTLGLGGNLLLIKPQLQQIATLKAKEQAIQGEFMKLGAALAEIKREKELGIDPFVAQKKQVAELTQKIRDIEGFINFDPDTATQLGELVRSLVKANPELTLASLKTKAGAIFYAPPKATTAKDKGVIDDVMAKFKQPNPQAQAQPQVVLVNKTLYKHGVEVAVKGSYPALLAYMREIERFPKRIFWSQVSLDAKNFREATFKLLIYTLSDQPTLPLN